MILIVGLGNSGQKYEQTRHNIGFMVLDKLGEDLLSGKASSSAWQRHNKFKGEYIKVKKNLLIIKPQTYMNLSGQCVSQFINFYKIDLVNLWVVHDDIDLPLGKIRIKIGGGAAGHNGIESIVKELGTSNFVRFRLGIGRGLCDAEKYVLSPFLSEEKKAVDQLITNVVGALILAIGKGLDRTMNEYN